MDPVPDDPAGVPSRGTPAGVSPPPGELGDLLRLSARGDQAAFATVYDATAARVHGLVLRVVRDRAQAEEVTQEVYLEVWRQASRYDAARGSALSWLMTIAHRKAVDRVRAAEAATRRDENYHHSHQVPAHDATAEAAHASLEARRVRTALTQLTDVQREAIQLAYFGGYTHTEVATLLDLPVGTAKTRIRDGLIRLRDAIGVGR
ncbi:ECF RNA polymerase sigma factor SigK [Nocardioides sp. zg-536]|uniref:RNA polymerase sigma factor n=1 Tax=Nocardioides faecalis TaxID=2803858 RepID=A0A938Y8K5_9ACTN|nr:ECF RNA polymerase sigma factor SigK [Nocardioides faecalis]MBM9459840.1 ECF RNA polymerase sigma factor SigK [Nocardioides faecalis]MBS4754471.1 ECF RNA polymerase sigma factor SigK [Nocardioides faecalis]QVI58919.1 ECF RNA polymerase sigma factor SigK [Nocardioides faecalis]